MTTPIKCNFLITAPANCKRPSELCYDACCGICRGFCMSARPIPGPSAKYRCTTEPSRAVSVQRTWPVSAPSAPCQLKTTERAGLGVCVPVRVPVRARWPPSDPNLSRGARLRRTGVCGTARRLFRGLMEGGPEVREHVDRGHGTTWHSTARHGMEEHRVTAQIRGLWNRSVGPRESGTARM